MRSLLLCLPLMALAACQTASAVSSQLPADTAPLPLPPSTPPPPVPPVPPNADWLLVQPEPTIRPTGDVKVDAYRQRLVEAGDPNWRPIFRRLLADIRVDTGQIARYDAMRAIDTPAEYIAHYLTPARVAEGRALYVELRGKDVSGDGTPLELKLALWGALSDYGKHPDMDLLTAMVTLAAHDRLRQATPFPIHEAAALILDRKVTRAQLRGHDSGRLGDIQYTPDFYVRLGKDGDGDGKIDVWDNRADILANLWIDRATLDAPFVTAVKPHRLDANDPAQARQLQVIGNQAVAFTWFTPWERRGWRPEEARFHGQYVEPFGKTGPAYLFSMGATPVASRNPYNIAYDYRIEDGFALAVGLLAEAIAGRPVHLPAGLAR